MALTLAQATTLNSICKGCNDTSLGTAVYTLEQAQPTGTVVGTTDVQTLTNKTLGVPNDALLTLGTTVTTAETKVTMEFDETTTGIGLTNVGSVSVPQVLNTNPGAGVISDTINILHSAGAGNCDDLYATYHKVAVTGAGDSGITVVGDAPRAYVGTTAGTTVAAEAYAVQPWAKHEGTGAITAMSGVSALLNVGGDNFTANTVNAGHFHVTGGATVTGQYDILMLEAYPDVRGLDAMLRLAADDGATVNAAIEVSGATTDFIKFAADGSGGATTSDPGVGAINAWVKCHIGNTIFWLQGYADA